MSKRAPREIELCVTDLMPDGTGVGQLDERVVQAKNALPGELVSVKVLKRRRGIWYGEASAPAARAGWSSARIEPACGYFPRCGGCAMQHIDYAEQLALKQQQLTRALAAVGVEPQNINPPVQGPKLRYRTKARLGVRVVGGEVLVGFRETLSNRVARMESCETLIGEFSVLLKPLRQLISSLSDPTRIPQIELAAGDHEQAIVVRHLDLLTEPDEELLREFAIRHDIRVFAQSAGYDSVRLLSSHASRYLGYANVDYGLYYEFLPWDFTQVNLAMNRLLVRSALAEFGRPDGGRVFDLFCGIGNFSLAAASLGWSVTGYEAAAESIDRAVMNAERNGLSGRCEFQVADLYDPGCELAESADYLLLDPPRSGAGPNLVTWLDSLRPRKVVYVSCQPASFAADAAVLQEKGYLLERVGVFDMFPNTAHIETLGSFSRSW